jgi:hypothetical protein
MSFTLERSESPPKNGLSQIFSKTRRRDKPGRDSRAGSLQSSGSDSLGLRESVEDAIDKIKGNAGSDDEGGIKKLLPKAIGAKQRRKKQEREDEQRATEEAARGRGIAERGTLANDARSYTNGSGDGSTSSLITNDSEAES